MPEGRTIVDIEAVPWVDAGGLELKLLRVSSDGSSVSFARAPAGRVFPPHVHIGPADIYYVSGAVETAGGTARAGMWMQEPAGVVHRATQTLGGAERTIEDLLSFQHQDGPLSLLDTEGRMSVVLDGHLMRAICASGMTSGGSAGEALSNPMHTPEQVSAIYKETYGAGIVDPDTLDWVPLPYDGVFAKLFNVTETGTFVAMVRGTDGAALPRRRYTAPTDYLVLTGALDFGDGWAPANHWVYEPMGHDENTVTHVGETVYLATSHGAIIDLDESGLVVRVLDAKWFLELSPAAVAIER